jgi:hypothetical protein
MKPQKIKPTNQKIKIIKKQNKNNKKSIAIKENQT